MPNSNASNRSALKEFLASIATIQGDLSNITAPPFVLAEHSTVELPQYWADHPSLFVASAFGSSPQERALLVLKWFLGSLRNQQYAGRKPEEGVKKPLNAFLGELFLGTWNDEELGDTKLVSEQVSHHPPVTACYLWNDKHGIRAEGFTRQEITFSGSVSIKQKGYAVLHIDRYGEDYLIPVPNVKVKGILTGSPYPELAGTYSLASSTGFVSEVKFEGKGLLGGGHKNGVDAKLFHVDQPEVTLFTVQGSWSGTLTFTDLQNGQTIETYDVESEQSMPIIVQDLVEQDPWESRKTWGGVINALQQGDMKTAADEKSVVEQGQRQMRKEEKTRDAQWERVFFRNLREDPIFTKLSSIASEGFMIDAGSGIWKVDRDAVASTRKPYHGDLLPTGKHLEPEAEESYSSTGEQQPKITGRDISNGQESRDSIKQKETAPAPAPVPPRASQQRTNEFKQVEGQTIQNEGKPAGASYQGKDGIDNNQVEEFLREKYSSNKA